MNSFKRNLSNTLGFKTNRKLIVFESDDWGSIRMPSNEVYNNLLKGGIDLLSDDGLLYNKYDTIATPRDLISLFEVLYSVKDSAGRPAVFTPVSVVANPDFKKIRQSDYTQYFFEPFTETLKRFPGTEDSFRMWKEGIGNGIFIPQFHGREHLNVKVWMRALKSGHQKTLNAFRNGVWGISTAKEPGIKVEFLAAFDFIDPNDIEYHKEVIISGLDLFETIFNYRATFFVPPNGPFSAELESVISEEGIKFLSSPKIQAVPIGKGKTRKRFHWLGQKSKYGFRYLTRNCFFEPSDNRIDWVTSCLNDISLAFKWNKPAVICSHRVNYIGALNEVNRDKGLQSLKNLLLEIIKWWPEAEFITSENLGEIIIKEESR